MESKILSIIIPVYNEEKTLEELLNKVLQVKLPHKYKKEVVMVNDGSEDTSWQVMLKLSANHKEIKSIQNEKNLGKTPTVKNGILKSTGDVVVIQDADLEYEPEEIIDILNLYEENHLDIVYGNRFGKKNKVIYWQNYFGNKLLSIFSNVFTYLRFKVWIPDMEVCYKLVRGDVFRDVAKNIQATSNFGFEPEITAKLSKYKKDGKALKLGIVPISYYPRSIAEGKKMNAIRDGLKAMFEIIKYNI